MPIGTTSFAGPAIAARLTSVLFAIFVVAAILVGWSARHEGHLTAEEGTGYLLGIAGSVMMLLLLVYPLRKRIRAFRAVGGVRPWFRAHMLFGVIGPTLILFHANFRLGSTNSTIAMLSMTSVVLSGLAGRYLYAKLHRGLYGQRAVARELLAEAVALRREIESPLPAAPPKEDDSFARFERMVSAPVSGLMSSILRSIALARATRRGQRELLRDARLALKSSGVGWRERRRRLTAFRDGLDDYFWAIRRAAALAVFERLFALWHVLHLPLFIMLVLTAIMHVVAVHLY